MLLCYCSPFFSLVVIAVLSFDDVDASRLRSAQRQRERELCNGQRV